MRAHDEHIAGWHVLVDGEHIADLDWLSHDDPGRYQFALTILTSDTEKLTLALGSTASRTPNDRIVLQNRATGGFVASIHDETFVGIRVWGLSEVPPFCHISDITSDE